MEGSILPEDDAQARYFGLCVFALQDIAVMQEIGLLSRPEGQPVVDPQQAMAVELECRQRGFKYTDEELTAKSWEFIQQWMKGGGNG